MGITLTLIGCFLLYSKSKYSPKAINNLRNKLKLGTKSLRYIGYVLFICAIVILGLQLGFWTGLVTFMLALMFGLCLTIIILPLHNRLGYFLCSLLILFKIIENII